MTGEEVARGREFARAALLGWGLPEAAETTALVVSELAGNVVRHAGTAGDRMGLRLEAGLDRVRIEVRDGDPRPPVPRVPGELDESGFGFVLIEAVAEKWGVDQAGAGKCVWAELAVSATATAS